MLRCKMKHVDVQSKAELVVSASKPSGCDHIWNAHGSCQWCHRERFELFAGDVARAYLVLLEAVQYASGSLVQSPAFEVPPIVIRDVYEKLDAARLASM